MQEIRTALFGTGFVGRIHLEGIRRLGYVQIYAIGEPEIDKAKALAAEFGATKTDADYRRILEDPAVDAVHVCVPNSLHFQLAKDALEAGKHVICEKPLATSVADTAVHEGFPGHDWHYKYMTAHAAEISNIRWFTPKLTSCRLMPSFFERQYPCGTGTLPSQLRAFGRPFKKGPLSAA